MKPKRYITEEIRSKIQNYIKNRMDVSSLIDNYILKDECFAGAIIKNFNRNNEDISNVNFVRCVIGEEGKITDISHNNFMGSNFMGCRFLGKIRARYCDFKNCNFNNVWMPDFEFQFSDVRNITICETVFKVGSRNGLGAKFEWRMFEDLAQYLQMDIEK